jgi:hypothetical protein
MTRTILLASAAALALAAPAAAKGPSSADISGPGIAGGIHVGSGAGGGDPSPGTPLGNLTAGAGFYPAVFPAGYPRDPERQTAPKGHLGPKYTITYTVPGPPGGSATIHQDLYPYAAGGAVTFMAPGQPVFGGRYVTHGGWYRGGAALKQTLVDAGLPATSPGGGGSSWFSTTNAGMWSTLAALALLLAAAAAFAHRRGRAATA